MNLWNLIGDIWMILDWHLTAGPPMWPGCRTENDKCKLHELVQLNVCTRLQKLGNLCDRVASGALKFLSSRTEQLSMNEAACSLLEMGVLALHAACGRQVDSAASSCVAPGTDGSWSISCSSIQTVDGKFQAVELTYFQAWDSLAEDPFQIAQLIQIHSTCVSMSEIESSEMTVKENMMSLLCEKKLVSIWDEFFSQSKLCWG